MCDLSYDLERIHKQYHAPSVPDILEIARDTFPDDEYRSDCIAADIYLYNIAIKPESYNTNRLRDALRRIYKTGYKPIYNRAMYIIGLERRG